MGLTQRGFTLIELLVTVLIVAILAAIAMPYYSDYVTRSRTAEATSTLSSLRLQMEQWFQDNRQYNSTGNPCTAPAATTNFTYQCSNMGTNTYTITALGNGAMNGFTYTINQNNIRGTGKAFNDSNLTSSNCWITNRNGSC